MIVLLLIGGCSTNWNFENTGLAKEHFDGNMYEYLRSDSYNWDSIRLIIERAELVPLFEGKDPITFIGPTNHSVRKWMNDKFDFGGIVGKNHYIRFYFGATGLEIDHIALRYRKKLELPF